MRSIDYKAIALPRSYWYNRNNNSSVDDYYDDKTIENDRDI